ncbi:MAG: hypothetical protein NTX22_16230 [Ignavibacteriales bacterium]|nr:hypothetical protein [Ignavibacteriales bacterium]
MKSKLALQTKIIYILLIIAFSASNILSSDKIEFSRKLNTGWFIQSSEKVVVKGNEISQQEFSTKNWYPATVPTTIMGALVTAKVYKDVYVGDNLKSVPTDQFKSSWWYRTEFVHKNQPNLSTAILKFDGINYRANIWLNGKQIVTADSLFGAFRRFEFDVSELIQPGKKNVLAIEVFPPQPGDPTIGFVDWNPKAPDRNMGIWRDVRLVSSGNVSIDFPFVKSKIDLQSFKQAMLTITSEVKNNTSKNISGILNANIGSIKLVQKVDLLPNERKLITFSPVDYPELNIKNPRIWWTHDYGKPELYDLNLAFNLGDQISDESKIQFGIREISDYLNDKGVRGYKLNGKNILIRGGGWVDDLLLNQDFKNLEAQLQYALHMNLNTIRLEGYWGSNEDLYNLCDKYGILLMTGWSCQWEWESLFGKPTDNFGGIKSPEDIKLVAQYTKDHIKWLRNHPSIFVWVWGSDLVPRPELEKEYMKILQQDDPTRPSLISASNKTSTLTGKSGVKMNGPYDYVPPFYWYSDSTNGGAFGFNTETGPGPQIPPIESIKKMFPENHLWPIDSIWYFHCGGNVFNDLKRYNDAMDYRLRKPASLSEYCTKAQFLNFEGMRAMFEAFAANKYKSTGIIQWMYNSAWPKLWWQLYDYYLMPNGAFYGAKKACEPIHLLYNYGTNEIAAVNNSLNKMDILSASIKIYNFDLKEKFSQNLLFNLLPDESKNIIKLPQIEDLTNTYFLDLRLMDRNKKVISNNFYCLSTKPDVLDYSKNEWYVTPTKEHSDLTDLNKLPEVTLKVKYSIKKESSKELVNIEIENPSNQLAFMIEINLAEKKSGESVLPIFWEDNYFSLLPGEKKMVSGYYSIEDLHGSKPILKISGWNIKPMEF